MQKGGENNNNIDLKSQCKIAVDLIDCIVLVPKLSLLPNVPNFIPPLCPFVLPFALGERLALLCPYIN